MKRSFFMWLIVGFFSLAWAQLDPKAAPFLEHMGASSGSQALPAGAKLKTVDYTMCFTSFDKGKAQPETCVRSAVDYVERRMTIRTTTREDESLDTDIVYRDGRVTMTDFLTGEPTVVPVAEAKPFKETLERTFDQVLQENFLPEQVERTHYDGPVSYGQVIRGEQVSATSELPSFDPEIPASKETTMRLIFGKNKALLGTITPTDDGDLLSVLTKPNANTFQKFLNTRSYTLEGDRPVLTLENRVTQFRFDKKLDEKLFILNP